MIALRCSGVLRDQESPIGFVYDALVEGDTEHVIHSAVVRAQAAGEHAEGFSETAEVVAQLDWRGGENGGELLFYPLGATLAVEYSDPDGDVRWSYPSCFSGL